MWSRKYGAMHKHCYDYGQKQANRNSMNFNAELVQALQDKVASLENETMRLMAQNSSLQRQLTGLDP